MTEDRGILWNFLEVLDDYSVSPSPSPFPSETGLWNLNFGLGSGTQDLDLTIVLTNKKIDPIKLKYI